MRFFSRLGFGPNMDVCFLDTEFIFVRGLIKSKFKNGLQVTLSDVTYTRLIGRD